MASGLRVQCLWENAVLPIQKTVGAVGYDISVPSDCVIPTLGKGTVETRLAVSLPSGTYSWIGLRSRIAVRSFIDVGARVVDSNYRGQIKVLLFNHSANEFPVKAGDRVAQIILEWIDTPQVRKVASLNGTDRGASGFGSTGMQSLAQSTHKNKKNMGSQKKNSLPSKLGT